MTTKALPSGLELAYSSELTQLEADAVTSDEKEAVRLARVALQTNRMPDNHVVGQLWQIKQRVQRVNKYGK